VGVRELPGPRSSEVPLSAGRDLRRLLAGRPERVTSPRVSRARSEPSRWARPLRAMAGALARPEAALFALVLLTYGYFYQAGGWNQNSRRPEERRVGKENSS